MRLSLVLFAFVAGCILPVSRPTVEEDLCASLRSSLVRYWDLDQPISFNQLARLKANPLALVGGQAIMMQDVYVVADRSKYRMYGIARGVDFSANGPAMGFGRAATFDGKGSYVVVPDTQLRGDVTVSAWVNQSARKTAQVFGSAEPSWASGHFALIVEDDGRPGFIEWISDAGDRPHLLASAPPSFSIRYGTWYHLAGVFRDDERKAYLYVDGQQIGSSDIVSYRATWKGGIGHGSGKDDFNGSIDDVRIYDRALSPAEIMALARTCLPDSVER